MALEHHSLAALIDQQMAANGAALDAVPRHSVGVAYFWDVLGVELRKAKSFARLAASIAREADAAGGDSGRTLELA